MNTKTNAPYTVSSWDAAMANIGKEPYTVSSWDAFLAENKLHANKVAAIKTLCEQSRLSPSSRFYMDNLAKNAEQQGITLDALEFAMGELAEADLEAIQSWDLAEKDGQPPAVATFYFETNPAATSAERDAVPAHMLAWPF
jgi:hypothetical protein